VVNPDEVDYESAIENIYTVNPNLLVGLSDQAREDIFEEFDRGFNDSPQITTAIYEWFNVDTDGGLDLRDKGDQEIFKWVLNEFSDSILFLLQDEKIYSYEQLKVMFKNGKFKRITAGGATVVRFVEFEYDTHYIQ
jgi:hypothetical protein